MKWLKMKLPTARNGAAYLAGGALAGVAVATHSVLLIPVLAAGVAWIGISQRTKRVRGVNYAANTAALIQSKSSKGKRRGIPAWQVLSHAHASFDRARQNARISC